MLGKSGSDGVGEAGTHADDRIGVFNCLTRLRRAGDTAIGADKTRLLFIKQPFSHQHRGTGNRCFRHPHP